MRIYKAEKDAGLDLESVSSASFVTAQVKVSDINEYFDGMSVAELMKETNTIQTVEELTGQEQPDLALVVAILVSTGWNNNDDIFTPAEVWKARSSPIHKPMNDNHNPTKILGHIVKSRVLDKSGNELVVAEGESIPDEFDIEVAGVLYRAFPELRDRVNEIISKAQDGEMFVSMEAWFPDFGYGFIDSDTGDIKLVERTEATAFLTKHLRIYGGSGEYEGHRIGRVLKEIIFGAQGFVDEPANPESVIKVAANKRESSQSFVVAKLDELLEGGGKDVDNDKQIQELKDSLAAKMIEVTELKNSADEFKAKEYDGQIAALKIQVDELTASATEASSKAETLETEKVELQKQFEEAMDRVEKSESELDGIRKDSIARDRLSQLSKIKKIEDEKATLAELRDMTDDTFDVVVKYAGEAKSEDNKEKETDEVSKTEAALDNVEETKDVDLNPKEDAKESEELGWAAMGRKLCGQKEKDEGGE